MTLLRLLAPLLIVTALVAGTACNGDDGPTDEEIQEALRLMVLQPSDIPEGLQPLGGSFSDNEQAASGLGGGPTKEQLDAWGRILGYSSQYQAGEPGAVSAPIALESSISLYETDQGASDSFNDRVARARAADWQTARSDLTEFEQKEVPADLPADATFWLQLSGYQAVGPGQVRLVSDDNILFRIGRAWGFLNVVSLANVGEDDRDFMRPEVETLARKQIEYIRDGLDSDLLD